MFSRTPDNNADHPHNVYTYLYSEGKNANLRLGLYLVNWKGEHQCNNSVSQNSKNLNPSIIISPYTY